MDYIYRLLKKNNVGSFKRLGNNPSALTKFLYVSEVLPHIDEYFITDKADGDRAFILINGASSKYITSKGEFPLQFDEGEVPQKFSISVFDCEYVQEVFYIFDVLEWRGENVSYKNFSERYNILVSLQDALEQTSCDFIKVKKFRKLDLKNYSQEIPAAFAEKRPYKTDGLIFTHRGAGYNKTQNLKWKPPEQLTIDFLYLEGILWVGINKKAWKQYGFPIPSYYTRLVAPALPGLINGEMITKDYFPVPFECSLGDFSAFPKDPALERKIIELSWSITKNKWIFHRIREDREVELKAGHYFGNNYEVAERTIQASLNPLTIDGLVEKKEVLAKNFYFEKSDDSYKSVRKFNNYVKDVVIKQYKSDYVLDMASGKGQDLQKYTSAGVRKILMLELDINAIDEIINRKYDILGKLFIPNLHSAVNTRGVKEGCILQIKQMDLNNPWKTNTDLIDKLTNELSGGSTKEKFPGSIFCNFALHYLMNDKKHMENICSFIAHFLKKGGEFIFTALDGEKVFDLIKKQPFKVDGRYLIELVNKTAKDMKFKGFEKIKVLLPCSSELYEEPLINIFELDKVLNSHGIVRVEHKAFDLMLNNFAEYRSEFYKELSDKDKEFIGLYSYTVYKKIE